MDTGQGIRKRLGWSDREAAAREIMMETGYGEKGQAEVLEEMWVAHRKL